ncbi:bifunctional transcriptional activator/DNA repair enzyme AdaA [Paenibacillus sp. LHD-117]|uniref:bifunctional transcriptional activator/DNA repair enzyme AdaA n=1 Tax=Paenibacillus sp. LHD-117 TaxID=3071412 RepID=UPI0027DFC044|nr:bifunctional transcriptional activator/DNA repair enzyme AdaA [Paenibacillus sp. LHD-117]MDQ6421537.1 bifunctional transcriptional activator/DNA repair enzyme AdaA [Paenibacillus sp. LHD-117]
MRRDDKEERKMGDAATEPEWQAIIGNDASYDGTFFYAVRTTGIFCRPSCKSKPPNRENASVFRTAEEARKDGYRSCKRCKPTGERLPDEEWVATVTDYIHNRYMDPLSLEKLADVGHGSPYHLHRTFKRVTGVTPVTYIQKVRIRRAQELLHGSEHSVTEVGSRVGIPNAPYFITLFKKETGHTPAQYRLLNGKGGYSE